MRMSMPWAVVVGLVAALGGAAARARAEDPPKPAAPVERRPIDLELPALVDGVARATGATFAWDPTLKQMNDRRVRVTRDLLGEGPPDLATLRRVLSYFEMVLIPMGEPGKPLYLIMDARQQGAILKLKAQPVEVNDANLAQLELMDGVFVTAALRIDGLTNLRDLRQALSRIVTQQNIGNVTEVPDANVFIVTDFAPSVAAIYRTLRQVEAARGAGGAAGREVRSVRLTHALAVDLARILTQTFAPPTQVLPNPSQPGPMSAPTPPRILADERTNQLVVTGTSAEIREVLALVASLDVPDAERRGPPPSPAVATVEPEELGRSMTLDFQDTPLAEVLAALARSAGLSLVLSERIDGRQRVTLQVTGARMRDVLSMLGRTHAFTWSVEPNGIVALRPK